MKENISIKNLSPNQSNVVINITDLITKKYPKKYIALPSAPGSGKSTTLIGALENLFSIIALKKDISKIDNKNQTNIYYKGYSSNQIKEEFELEYLENPYQKKKILILSFSKNTIDDFIKKSDKVNIKTIVQEEIEGQTCFVEKETKMSLFIEASTYHSLLLKVANPIIEKLGYIPDYSKSNFYKKDLIFINKKFNMNFNDKEIDLIYKLLIEYHNSPLIFSDFIKNHFKEDFKIDFSLKVKNLINYLYVEMKNKNITMPHCFYYKLVHKLAIENPDFLKKIFSDLQGNNYSAIFVDEAQDSDAIIYDLIKRSNHKAVFVGDTFQNIYGFRGTYNVFDDLEKESLQDTNFLQLNESFRYGKAIAKLSTMIPMTLKHNNLNLLIDTEGKKENDYIHNQSLNLNQIQKILKNIIITNENEKKLKKESMNQNAIICRSNKRAFEIYSELKNNPLLKNNVKIESGLKAKTKDFVNKGGNAIEDESIKENIKKILNKEEFTFDDIVNNNEVCTLLSNTEYSFILKCKDEKLKEAMIQKSTGYEAITIITVHGSKGLEYNNVFIADDYIKNELSTNQFFDIDEMNISENQNISNDEINIIYTAITRAKNNLFFMDSPLFDLLSKEIKICSDFNSKLLAKENNYYMNADVLKIENEKKSIKEDNEKNIFKENLLFN